MRKSTLALFGVFTILVAGCNSIKSPTADIDLLEVRVCPLPAAVSNCDALAQNPSACIAQAINLPAGTSRTFCGLGRYESLVSPDDNIAIPEQWRNISSQVVWNFSPNADGVLTVSADGVVSNVGGGATGTYQITGTADGLESDPSTIRATAPELQSLDIEPIGFLSESRLVGQTDQFTCFGRYSAPFCNGQINNTRCKIENPDWHPAPGTQAAYSVNAAGLGTALSASNGYVDIWCSVDDPNNGLLESPTASVYVCDPTDPGTIQSVTIVNVPTGALTIGAAPYQLAAEVTFVDCNPAANGQTRTVRITDGVQWGSSDTSILTVTDSGAVSGVGIGTASVTAEIGGVPATPVEISVVADAANPICALTDITSQVEGATAGEFLPARTLLLPGVNFQEAYQAQLVCLDNTTGEPLAPEATINSVSDTNAVWSVAPLDGSTALGLVVNDQTSSVVDVRSDAEVPKTWVLTLTYTRPANSAIYTQQINLNLLSATLTDLEVNPTLVCVGGVISTSQAGQEGLLGAVDVPVQSYGIYEVAVPGETDPRVCSINVSDLTEWETSGQDLTSNLIDLVDLGLPALVQDVVGGCQELIGYGLSMADSPIAVDNTDKTDDQALIVGDHGATLAAGACVYSYFGGEGVTAGNASPLGASAALVSTEAQLVCDLLLDNNGILVDSPIPSVPSCDAVLSAK